MILVIYSVNTVLLSVVIVDSLERDESPHSSKQQIRTDKLILVTDTVLYVT